MSEEARVTIRNLRTLAVWGLVAYLGFLCLKSLEATLIIFGLAILLAIIADGPIRYLDRHGLSRGMSVAVIVLLLLGSATAIVAVSVRPVMNQVHEITVNAPRYVDSIERRIQAVTGQYPYLEQRFDNGDVGRWLSSAGQRLASQLGRFSMSVAGGLVTTVLVLVTALYTVLDPKPLFRGVVTAVPYPYQRVVFRSIVGAARQLQKWAVATVWLMLIVGTACGIGLWAIGVKWALLFGILAGIGEAIPTIGPILTAIPPTLVAFADEPVKAVWVILLFLVVQQLEQHLLVPRIMAVALNLHPVSVLFFVVALGSILGPLGILLATPLCATVKVAYGEYRKDARRRAEREESEEMRGE